MLTSSQGTLHPLSPSYLYKILELLMHLVSLSQSHSSASVLELCRSLKYEHKVRREVTLQVMRCSTTSTRFHSLHAPINLYRKVISICSTRHLPPCGPCPITATAVGTWQQFSLFGRTACMASQYMDPLRKTSTTQRSNRQDMQCCCFFN